MKTLTITPIELQSLERALNYTQWTDCRELQRKLKRLLNHGRDRKKSVDSVVMQWANTKPKEV